MQGVRLYFFIWMIFFSCASFAGELTSITLNTKQDQTKVIFMLSREFSYHEFMLNAPSRIVIDFKDTKLKNKLNVSIPKNLIIKKIREGQHGNDLRIVLDTSGQVIADYQIIKSNSSKNYSLVVSIVKIGSTTKVKAPSVVLKSPKKLRNLLVVIDPGHGGRDPGAIGTRGTYEKNVVFAIAKELKSLIDSQYGMRAVLTRDKDFYIPLRKRLDIAREQDADVFISIHADAFKRKAAQGASVFALSQRGATSEAARWIAEKENYSELAGVDLSDLGDKSDMVRSVLIDLSQTATISSSLKLAHNVLLNLDNVTVLHGKEVEQARFVVLKSPDIPSILIETGFLSNYKEERKLVSKSFQKKTARAILKGLKVYFWDSPPMGTYLAELKKEKLYRVVKGDSLSQIASKFNLSTKKLIKANNLQSSVIRVGQLLYIPLGKV